MLGNDGEEEPTLRDVWKAQVEAAKQEEESARAEHTAALFEMQAAELEEQIASTRWACAQNHEHAARALLELAHLTGEGRLVELERMLADSSITLRDAEHERRIAVTEKQRTIREVERAEKELNRAEEEHKRVTTVLQNEGRGDVEDARQKAENARADAQSSRLDAVNARAAVDDPDDTPSTVVCEPEVTGFASMIYGRVMPIQSEQSASVDPGSSTSAMTRTAATCSVWAYENSAMCNHRNEMTCHDCAESEQG